MSNVVTYGLCRVLTHRGVASKRAMTLFHAAGVAQNFVLHTHWSFRDAGPSEPQLRRYLLAFAAGYGINLGALFALVDGRGWAHQLAQGILMLATAILVFPLQKLWVFRTPARPSNTPLPTA